MTEIRALLLTDVVDSTQLSEELGDAKMATVWMHHDRVARDLLTLWHGREIDKTDGMLLMFEQTENAVRYAHGYHAALALLEPPLKARAGLHVGPIFLRENSAEDVALGAKPLEVDGLCKPVAARIMSIASGAQTLISAEAMADLHRAEQGTVGEKLQTESHGHWMMKGIGGAIEIFEVVPFGGAFRVPPDGEKVYRVIRVDDQWMPTRDIPNNLPAQISRFIGREKELRDIKELLGASRLVTLVGMGGVGKTRLSLYAATELMHKFPDGVWFLDLAPIIDPALVLTEAAQVLGVRQEPERPLLASMCDYLRHRRVLIVMDNCEHLVHASANLAHTIVKSAPHVRLAASSREALRVPGERIYPIAPLSVPQKGDSLAQLQASASVRLFVDRAQAQKPSFELTAADAPAVAELVARLEGIPLALELAAARVRSLSVAEINQRLNDRYKILTGGSRVLQQRQQTLRALVDWSYDMLQAVEKTLLNRLACFRGGFNLEAAEAVCGTEPLSTDEVLDLLGSLVEKSLVMVSDNTDLIRYKMLETVREYAYEKLSASGEVKATQVQHCHYYLGMAKKARAGLLGAKQGEWLARFEIEQDNLRAAMGLAQANDGTVDPILTVKLAVAQQNFWILRGHASEGRAAVQAMLALPAVQASPMVHGHALYVAALLAWSQSDHVEALSALSICLTLRRELADPALLAATLSALALARLSAGDGSGALAAALEGLALFRECGDPGNEAILLLQLGEIEFFQANDGSATEHVHQALVLAHRIEHPETEAEAMLILGQIAFEAQELTVASREFAISLAICQAAGDRRGVANAVWWQSKIDLLGGRLELARIGLGEALAAFNAFEMREQMLGCLEDHADLALALNYQDVAVGLASASQQLRENAGLTRSIRAAARWDLLQLRLGDAGLQSEWGRLWCEAQQWNSETILRRALAVTQGQLGTVLATQNAALMSIKASPECGP